MTIHASSVLNDRAASAILRAGFAIGVLDALDALVAYKLVLGMGPIPIYQFVASGAMGKAAFTGGVPTALVGVAIHFLIAFSLAGAYWGASRRVAALRRAWVPFGLLFGAAVFLAMNHVVVPLSAIGPSPFSLPLFLNGLIGHALLVGLPAAYFSREQVG